VEELEAAAEDSGRGLMTLAEVVGIDDVVVEEEVSGKSPPLVIADSPPEVSALVAVVDSGRAVGVEEVVPKGVEVDVLVAEMLDAVMLVSETLVAVVLVSERLVTVVLVIERLVDVSVLLVELSPRDVTVIVVDAVVEVVGVRPPPGAVLMHVSGYFKRGALMLTFCAIGYTHACRDRNSQRVYCLDGWASRDAILNPRVLGAVNRIGCQVVNELQFELGM
jgi:hypothetical protein